VLLQLVKRKRSNGRSRQTEGWAGPVEAFFTEKGEERREPKAQLKGIVEKQRKRTTARGAKETGKPRCLTQRRSRRSDKEPWARWVVNVRRSREAPV